jgi:hypothetical protein
MPVNNNHDHMLSNYEAQTSVSEYFGLMSARYIFVYEENNLRRRNRVKNSMYTSKIHLENCVLSEVEPQASLS